VAAKRPHARSRQRPASVTRREFDRVLKALEDRENSIKRLGQELDTQFRRIAQIQAELDEIRKAWERMGSST
jgi:hypothetical protein